MGGMARNISVQEAIAAFARIEPIAPKRIPLFEATGLRVAEDVAVRRPVPCSPQAARDGWAIRAAATVGATRRTPMPLGEPALQVDAGAPLPEGADAVLAPDEVIARQKGPCAIRPVKPGVGTMKAGGLAAAGEVLVPAGTRINFAIAMACAQSGVMDIVVRRPVADIIFNTAGITRQRDHWAGVLSAAIRGSGSEIGAVQFTAGDQAHLTEALLASSADIIAVVGGTGEGPGDTTMPAIASAGQAIFHGVRMHPGGTMGFGMVGGKPVFASPGGIADMLGANIVMSWHVARRAFGRPPAEPQLQRGRLTAALPASPARSRLVFARYAAGAVTPFLADNPTPALLAASNCSIFVPEGARHRRAGEQVEVLRMGVSM